MSRASGASPAPQAVDTGPAQPPRLWTQGQTPSRSCSGFCQWQLLLWNPAFCLAPGELLLWHLLPTTVLSPAPLQEADELPSAGMLVQVSASMGCSTLWGKVWLLQGAESSSESIPTPTSAWYKTAALFSCLCAWDAK